MALPCVILAGGLGSRMGARLNGIPKALVPVAGRPFADLQLTRLRAGGVGHVVYCIGHLGQVLVDHVGDGARFGLHVDYVDEGAELRGTAGALRLALDRGALPEVFHLMYGDSLLAIDFAAVETAWRTSDLPAQMVVLQNHGRWDRSNVIVRGGRVELYEPNASQSHPGMNWIDYGLSTLTSALVTELVPPVGVVQLPSVWANLSTSGRLGAFEVHERFYEVGSPTGLEDLERHLSEQG